MKIAKNSKFSKFSKNNFFIMDWDMNIGVIPDENTSLRCVLIHSSPFRHPHNRNPSPTYPHRRFLAIFREVWSKMLQKMKFLVSTCWPKVDQIYIGCWTSTFTPPNSLIHLIKSIKHWKQLLLLVSRKMSSQVDIRQETFELMSFF